jgi:hypothetical protein
MAPPATLRDALQQLGAKVRTGFGQIRISYRNHEPVSIEAMSEQFANRDLELLLDEEIRAAPARREGSEL